MLSYTANNVSNAVATKGPSDYDPTSTNDDIRIVADAGVNGDVAVNHVAGTLVDGDLVIQLPSASNKQGQEIYIHARTHSSTNLVKAGQNNGSGVYGNYIYVSPQSGDNVSGNTAMDNSTLLNTNAVNNTVTLVSDGVNTWAIQASH